ncbi:MAG: metallophosphoesterase [Anaerolineae bacterium]|nr:metallophosphoesterase [Anaerolineae bacterium]
MALPEPSTRPSDLPDYRPNWLHQAIVASDTLSRVPAGALIPPGIALAVAASLPWGKLWLPAALLLFAFTVADGVSLALLPHLRRSYGPVTPPLVGLALVRALVNAGWGVAGREQGWPPLTGCFLAHTFLFALAFYATWIEPSRVGVTRMTLRSPKLNGYEPVRLLHISDLHVERLSVREERLLELVRELAPHVIVMTGDYLTLSSVYDESTYAGARYLLERLCTLVSPDIPIYAVTGSPPVDHPSVVPDVFAGLPITWLSDAVAELCVNGHRLRLVGLRCTAHRERDAARLHHLLDAGPQDAFTVLLYHSPDVMPEAVESGVDLYLCGHTHGGQIRLPFFGALLTSSVFWKRYEMGRYQEQGTTLYVSRGLGMEGMGAPRARFLSPPEVVVWTLEGEPIP